ncbi:MAG: nucleotidyltransferase domain-containing protein [Planctomycetes bacterium]|nr:nucleotidyltransferase domain-containing protein [Planctomycetota bacterium]
MIREVASRLRGDPGFRLSLKSLVGPPRKRTRERRKVAPNRGPFASEADALAVVVDRLVAAHRPAAVYLFGSRAMGEARPDSDFDLLLVFPGTQDIDSQAAYAPLLGLGVGCDVVPCSESDFDADAAIPGTLCYEAATRGRLLYSG